MIDQTTAILLTCAVGALFTTITMQIMIMIFINELNKESIKEVQNGN